MVSVVFPNLYDLFHCFLLDRTVDLFIGDADGSGDAELPMEREIVEVGKGLGLF